VLLLRISDEMRFGPRAVSIERRKIFSSSARFEGALPDRFNSDSLMSKALE